MMKTLILMNREYEVCTLDYDTEAHAIAGIVSRGADYEHGPICLHGEESSVAARLRAWWGGRSVPASRPHITDRLTRLGLETSQELTELNNGLSLSDQYWMRVPDSKLKWSDINFFTNSFSDETGRWLVSGSGATAPQSLDLNTPDNTSDGNLPKRWTIIGNNRYLLKGGGFLNQEPFNELIATELYRRILGPEDYVPYELLEEDETTYSICPNMLKDDEEYVPATYVDQLLPYTPGEEPFAHYLRCCMELGVCGAKQHLSKMLVCDYLMANFDRHYRNFGLIRNVHNLTWRPAPLFDSGSALWCDKRTLRPEALSYQAAPFINDSWLQLQLVDDFSWFEPSRLSGFLKYLVDTLAAGPLKNYGMRLITIDDALDERISKFIDYAQSK
jgi:hypothetical protein